MMSWITLKTTNMTWEAEWMQQLLESHGIPSRIVNIGGNSCFLSGQAALQVLTRDRWTALLLLSPVEEENEKDEE